VAGCRAAGTEGLKATIQGRSDPCAIGGIGRVVGMDRRSWRQVLDVVRGLPRVERRETIDRRWWIAIREISQSGGPTIDIKIRNRVTQLALDLLEAADDDYTDIAWAHSAARRLFGPQVPDRVELVAAAVRRLVDDGDVEFGTFHRSEERPGDSGWTFVPDRRSGAALEAEILEASRNLPEPRLGDIGWLRITARGERHVRGTNRDRVT